MINEILKIKKRLKNLFYHNNTNLFDENDVISEYFLNDGNLENIDFKLLKKCFYICYEEFHTNHINTEYFDNLSYFTEYQKDSYKQCKKCADILINEEFTKYNRKFDNKIVDYPYCKKCVREINNERYKNPEYAKKMKTKSSNYRKNPNYQTKYREYKKKWYAQKKYDPKFREKINEYQRTYRLSKKQNVC